MLKIEHDNLKVYYHEDERNPEARLVFPQDMSLAELISMQQALLLCASALTSVIDEPC